MQSRLTPAYVAVLEALRHLVPTFQPRKVICDFEKAQTAAWRRVFPNVETQGCYFHFTKESHIIQCYWYFPSDLQKNYIYIFFYRVFVIGARSLDCDLF